MSLLENQLPAGRPARYAKTHTTGGRENGVSRHSDGRLEVNLSLQARRAPAAIRSSSLPPAGRHASKARSGSPSTTARFPRPRSRSMRKSVCISE
jgi:hypothetical protein